MKPAQNAILNNLFSRSHFIWMITFTWYMSLGLGHETSSGPGYSLVCAIVQNRIKSSYGIDGDPNKEVTVSQGVSYGPT